MYQLFDKISWNSSPHSRIRKWTQENRRWNYPTSRSLWSCTKTETETVELYIIRTKFPLQYFASLGPYLHWTYTFFLVKCLKIEMPVFEKRTLVNWQNLMLERNTLTRALAVEDNLQTLYQLMLSQAVIITISECLPAVDILRCCSMQEVKKRVFTEIELNCRSPQPVFYLHGGIPTQLKFIKVCCQLVSFGKFL